VRLERLVARGFRNLADLDCEPSPAGAAILGANGQGKTNLLEALYYPVLFRSLRGAPDPDGWKPAMRFLFPARTRWDAPIDATEEAARR